MLKFDAVEEVMMEEKGHVTNGEEFKKNFESFGIDFADVGSAIKGILGNKDGAVWMTGFYTALLVASKYWEYRTPPE